MPADGHENCPLMANRSAHQGSAALAMRGAALVHGRHAPSREGLGEADRFTRRLTDVSVVQ